MFVIGEVEIDEQLAHERFSCDVAECKGACCTLHGGRGAPLEDHEVGEIMSASAAALKYLSDSHRTYIEQHGMVEGAPGDRTTVCIDNRDCVFVCYEEGIARCSFEKAYLNGESDWRKPLSCHLFPIRNKRGERHHLRYEMISECRPGVSRGRRERTPLYKFLEEPLTRAFGTEWYELFRAACDRHNGKDA